MLLRPLVDERGVPRIERITARGVLRGSSSEKVRLGLGRTARISKKPKSTSRTRTERHSSENSTASSTCKGCVLHQPLSELAHSTAISDGQLVEVQRLELQNPPSGTCARSSWAYKEPKQSSGRLRPRCVVSARGLSPYPGALQSPELGLSSCPTPRTPRRNAPAPRCLPEPPLAATARAFSRTTKQQHPRK